MPRRNIGPSSPLGRTATRSELPLLPFTPGDCLSLISSLCLGVVEFGLLVSLSLVDRHLLAVLAARARR
jgi:hypothetical protein